MLTQIDNVRLAFPALFKPTAANAGDTPYFSALFPIEPGSKNEKVLDAAIQKVAAEKFGPKAEAALAQIVRKGDCFFRKEVYLNKDGDPYTGFEDMHRAKGSNKDRLILVDRLGKPVVEGDGVFYAGCIVNVQFDIWVQDNQFGRKINGKLLAVQFVKDAESFGGGVRVGVNTFKPLEEEEEAGDLG